MNNLVKITYVLVSLLILYFVFKEKQENLNTGLNIHVKENGFQEVMITSDDVELDIMNNFQSNLVGEPLKDINIDELEAVIENNPFVKSAEVFIDNNEAINISIDQNVPIVRLIGGSEDLFLTSNAELIPLSKHFVPKVMVVSGFEHFDQSINLDTVVLNDISKLYKISKYIYESNFLRSMISQINIKNNELVLIPKIGYENIVFGSSDDYLEKLGRVEIYYDSIVPVKGWGALKSVNVSIEDQIRFSK